MNITKLHSLIRQCTKCPLHKDLPDGCCPVPGVGNYEADLMFVGEALGENEVVMEEPFVGVAGQLLTKMMTEAGINRKECYITNVVHCRPTVGGKGRKNRAPTEEEITACKNWLWNEMLQVNPKVILMMGKVPTYTLLHSVIKKSFKMGEVVGKSYQVEFFPSLFVPCYHPSYLLVHKKEFIEMTIDIFKMVYNISLKTHHEGDINEQNDKR